MKLLKTLCNFVAWFTVSTSVLAENTIVIWYEGAEPQYQKVFKEQFIDPFNSNNDKYKVKVEFINSVGQNTQMSLMAKRDSFDIFMSEGPSILKKFVSSGQVASLDKYAEQYGWNEKYQDSMLNSLKVDGKLYGLPKTFEALTIFYNKKLFDEKGWTTPESIQDLITLANKIKKDGKQPFAAGNKGWKGANEWYISALQASCLTPEDSYNLLTGELDFSSEKVKTSFENLNNWYNEWFTKKDYYSLNTQEMGAGVTKGIYPMTISGTWSFQFIDENVGVFPVPVTCTNTNESRYSIAIGAAFSLNANSKNLDGAAYVLDKLLSKETFIKMSDTWPGEWLIPLKELPLEDFKDKVTPDYYEHVISVLDAMNVGNIGYATWTFYPPKTRQYLIDKIESVWGDQLSLDDYLQGADKLFKRELKRGDVPTIPKPTKK